MQSSVDDPPRWWLWPTILSLDAPVVLMLWQALLAARTPSAPSTAESLVLGLSVWLAYTADRWIEAWRLDPSSVRTHRHLFHQRWRWPVAAAWTVALALDVAEAARGLDLARFKAGLILLVPVCAYLLSHQLLHRDSRWRAPKEACVAVLLASGAALFVAAHPGARWGALAPSTGIFALLCFSNCTLISLWEDEVDLCHGQTSLALQLPGAGALRIAPWAVAALCGAAWLLKPGFAGTCAPCGAASGALLGIVDLAERRTGHRLARVLADAALLSPALPLLLGIAR